MKAKDYYGLLGVPKDATPDRIRRAYRRLARQWHPDAAGGSAEQFRTLRDAYETLSDAAARERYDRSLGNTGTTERAVWPSGGPDDGRFSRSPTASGEILLSAEEARRGGNLPLDIPVRTPCKSCGGHGVESWACWVCGGDGFVISRLPVALRLPAGVRDGAVFQIHMDTGVPLCVFLTVHVVR